MEKDIIIGRHGFNGDKLKECKTLKEAKEIWPNMPESVVKKAFYSMHPKKKR